ncbi:hypothetical protein [Pedobacter sp. WC2423]|uniref:hypothetical protein n=1 Tax=Pedobacter sp. WC2423 TaxID=3234142 RepID=UPI003466C97D
MKQFIILLSTAILLISCNGKHNDTKKITDSVHTNAKDVIHQKIPSGNNSAQPLSPEVVKAKEWIIANIENSLNKGHDTIEDSNEEAKSIYTTQYSAYKIDAINVDLDDGLTEDEFITKWKGKYNPKLAGIGFGFLIPEQDYGLIKVTECKLKNKTPDGFVFNVVLEDTNYHKKYNRDIRIIVAEKSFLIDDVLEY